MGKIHHADDAEHHRIADGNQAVDRTERDAIDELLDEVFHASAALSESRQSLNRGAPQRQCRAACRRGRSGLRLGDETTRTGRPSMDRVKSEDAIGAKGRPFTGAEYLESLRDGREVYVYGERVKDVTTHPAFRNAARSIARLYD